MSTAAVRRYWTRIAAMGCIVCEAPAEIAHAHGGSMRARGYTKAKGKKLDYMDWLVIPLCPDHHRLCGDSLDLDTHLFEHWHGTQVAMIDKLIARTGVNVWDLAVSRHASDCRNGSTLPESINELDLNS